MPKSIAKPKGQHVVRTVEYDPVAAHEKRPLREITGDRVRFYLADDRYIEVSPDSRGGLSIRGGGFYEQLAITPESSNVIRVQFAKEEPVCLSSKLP